MNTTPQSYLNVWDGTDTTAALVHFRIRDTRARLVNPEVNLADVPVVTMSGAHA